MKKERAKPLCLEEVDVFIVPGGRTHLKKCSGKKGHKGDHTIPTAVIRVRDQKTMSAQIRWRVVPPGKLYERASR